MIRAEFFVRNQGFCGLFGFRPCRCSSAGSNIVCAAVSSAVYLDGEPITEVLGVEAEIQQREDGFLALRVAAQQQEVCQQFFKALWIHLSQL